MRSTASAISDGNSPLRRSVSDEAANGSTSRCDSCTLSPSRAACALAATIVTAGLLVALVTANSALESSVASHRALVGAEAAAARQRATAESRLHATFVEGFCGGFSGHEGPYPDLRLWESVGSSFLNHLGGASAGVGVFFRVDTSVRAQFADRWGNVTGGASIGLYDQSKDVDALDVIFPLMYVWTENRTLDQNLDHPLLFADLYSGGSSEAIATHALGSGSFADSGLSFNAAGHPGTTMFHPFSTNPAVPSGFIAYSLDLTTAARRMLGSDGTDRIWTRVTDITDTPTLVLGPQGADSQSAAPGQGEADYLAANFEISFASRRFEVEVWGKDAFVHADASRAWWTAVGIAAAEAAVLLVVTAVCFWLLSVEGRRSHHVGQLLAAKKASEHVVSYVCHEVRNPLQLVVGALDMLEEDHLEALSPETDELLLYIRKGADSIQHVLNDVLSARRLHSGDFSVRPSVREVRHVFRDLANLIRQELPAGASVEFRVDVLPDVIHIDAGRAKQIITNGIVNAIRAAKPGSPPEVVVTAEHVDRCLLVAVWDRGVGLQGKNPASLFRSKVAFVNNQEPPVWRPEVQSGMDLLLGRTEPPLWTTMVRAQPLASLGVDARTADIHTFGVGLGLPLCKRLAWRMGGDVGLVDHQASTGWTMMWAVFHAEAAIEHYSLRFRRGTTASVAARSPSSCRLRSTLTDCAPGPPDRSSPMHTARRMSRAPGPSHYSVDMRAVCLHTPHRPLIEDGDVVSTLVPGAACSAGVPKTSSASERREATGEDLPPQATSLYLPGADPAMTLSSAIDECKPTSGGTTETSAASTVVSIAATPSARPYVLIVDDEPLIRKMASRHVKKLGMVVETLEDGADVQAFLRSHPPPALILLDIVMVRSNGKEVLAALREREEAASIPAGARLVVYAMTGNVGTAMVRQYQQLGFDGVLAKPFRRSNVQQVLDHARRAQILQRHCTFARVGVTG